MCIPLTYLDEAPLREIADLPLNEFKLLMQRLKEACDTQDRRKKVLNEALKIRFGGLAADLLHQEGKDTGTVRFREHNALIVVQFRKKVEWDQAALQTILEQHPELQPTIKRSYAVEEKQYGSLPEDTQKILATARAVKVAGYDFSIKLEEKDAEKQ